MKKLLITLAAVAAAVSMNVAGAKVIAIGDNAGGGKILLTDSFIPACNKLGKDVMAVTSISADKTFGAIGCWSIVSDKVIILYHLYINNETQETAPVSVFDEAPLSNFTPVKDL